MKNVIGIYKITNPKNRIYIGQSVHIHNRFAQYKKYHCKKQPRLYSSLMKYGYENHKFEIISICTVDELNEQERYYQELYCCLNKSGLNCIITKLGDRSGYATDESKQKMSISQKNRNKEVNLKISIALTGKKLSKETKEKLRIINTGKKHSEETKLKMSLTSKNNNSIKRLKESKCRNKWIIDTSTGIKYLGTKAASEAVNIPLNTLRKKICNYVKNNTSLMYL
jgi:group I intron endonuclease